MIQRCAKDARHYVPIGNLAVTLVFNHVIRVRISLILPVSSVNTIEFDEPNIQDSLLVPFILLIFPVACPSCPEVVKVKCHCQSMVLKFSCGKLANISDEAKREMFSCKIQCPTLMTCQHSCKNSCHPADETHSSPIDCKKKCALKCECGRIKEQQQCYKITKGYKIACDQECRNVADTVKKVNSEVDAESNLKIYYVLYHQLSIRKGLQ